MAHDISGRHVIARSYVERWEPARTVLDRIYLHTEHILPDGKAVHIAYCLPLMETRFMLRAEEAASDAAPCAPPPECAFPAVAGCIISLLQREVLVVFAVEVSEVRIVLSCKCFHNEPSPAKRTM